MPEIKVKDRRRFSADGELLETAADTDSKASEAASSDADAAPDAAAAEGAAEAPAGKTQEAPRAEPAAPDAGRAPPLPPASFDMLVLSLAMQAQMELGGGGMRQQGQAPNLEIARHTIDLLAMLREKTKGNLSMEENRMLENTLTELRFRYVQVVGEINKKATSSRRARRGARCQRAASGFQARRTAKTEPSPSCRSET